MKHEACRLTCSERSDLACISYCTDLWEPEPVSTSKRLQQLRESSKYTTDIHRVFITARKRSCGEVMFLQLSVILFTGGSASVHAGIVHPPRSRSPLGRAPPPLPRANTPLTQCMLGDTVNKRAICILLECNLVSNKGAFTLTETATNKNGLCRIMWRCSYCIKTPLPLGTAAIISVAVSVKVCLHWPGPRPSPRPMELSSMIRLGSIYTEPRRRLVQISIGSVAPLGPA